MRSVPLLRSALVALAAILLLAPAGQAQLPDRLKKAAKQALEDETARQIDRLLREAIRCALDDPICPQEAEKEGKSVIYTDADGEVITDDEGAPITDRTEAADKAGVRLDDDEGPAKPGEGVWANYDFVPGENVLFVDDFDDDDAGDFPRKLEYLRGNMEVVEWEGRKLLRATGDNSRFAIALAEALPQRFTLEFAFHDPITENGMDIYLGEVPERGRYEHPYVNFGHWRGSGLWDGGPLSTVASDPVEEGLVTGRIMADGEHVRIYMDEIRIANVPRAELQRTNAVTFVMWARRDRPMYIGDIRLAAGGRDLYDALAANGRVATRGILFAVGSHEIRPESTPTLEEIGEMLQDHSDLELVIEGHTDSDGDEAANQALSQRRAESVKAYLVERFGIAESRLEPLGMGESQPVASNDTSEGKQQNRRVELVRK